MRKQLLDHNIRNLKPVKRDCVHSIPSFRSTYGVLSISLVVVSSFLFLKQERVVVVPPVLQTAISIDGNRPSPAYLEQMGIFLCKTLLEKNPVSCVWQKDMVLKHTSPAFFTTLRSRLIEEEKVLRDQKSSYTFNLRGVEVVAKENAVILEGDRTFYLGGKQISNKVEKYRMSFVFHAGRILIDSLEEISS